MKILAALAALILAAACGAAKTTPANCMSFSDLTADATPTVNFGGVTYGNNYVPRCATVKTNQTVTFAGDFTIHPISQTSGPAAIPHTTSGTTLDVTFPTAATYEYQCDAHHAAGMTGAIQVVP